MSRDALLRNKHLCCEKPLTNTLADAQELSELSCKQKTVLFGAFHRRYNKSLLKVIDKLKSKPIAHVEGNYLEKIEEHLIGGNGEWYLNTKLAGGGYIMDNGPTIYDTIVQFMDILKSAV